MLPAGVQWFPQLTDWFYEMYKTLPIVAAGGHLPPSTTGLYRAFYDVDDTTVYETVLNVSNGPGYLICIWNDVGAEGDPTYIKVTIDGTVVGGEQIIEGGEWWGAHLTVNETPDNRMHRFHPYSSTLKIEGKNQYASNGAWIYYMYQTISWT